MRWGTALNIAEIPVFILCGGLGTRLKEMTEFRPKPMVTIGPDPILLHIMKHYSSFGFCRFVLCMGYKSEIIRDYFLNFYQMNSDVTIELKTNSIEVHSVDHSCDWRVTLAYTGEVTMTGGRGAIRCISCSVDFSSASFVSPSMPTTVQYVCSPWKYRG